MNFIVKENGVPCALVPFRDLFGTNLVPRTGVLVKSETATVFKGEKSAQRAITKAYRLSENLRQSLLGDWDKLTNFIKRGKFTIEHL